LWLFAKHICMAGTETWLVVSGIVDFDVFDALKEFPEVVKLLGFKGCSSLETRVYVPVFPKGDYIVYAHSVLQWQCGLRYTSE